MRPRSISTSEESPADRGRGRHQQKVQEKRRTTQRLQVHRGRGIQQDLKQMSYRDATKIVQHRVAASLRPSAGRQGTVGSSEIVGITVDSNIIEKELKKIG